MEQALLHFFEKAGTYVWGTPMLVLLVGTGIFLTSVMHTPNPRKEENSPLFSMGILEGQVLRYNLYLSIFSGDLTLLKSVHLPTQFDILPIDFIQRNWI